MPWAYLNGSKTVFVKKLLINQNIYAKFRRGTTTALISYDREYEKNYCSTYKASKR